MAGYLGTYRLLLSDALVLTQCEPPFADRAGVAALVAAALAVKPDLRIVQTVFRPRPAQPVRGRRVAFFTTAPEGAVPRLAQALADDHGADVVLVSTGLADRSRLAADVARAAREADVFLTEIKAAAVDVVAEAAAAAGRELVFCDNEPVTREGDLGGIVDELEELAVARFAARDRRARPAASAGVRGGGLTMLDDRDVRLIDEGDEAPFSKGLMAQTLMATGLAPERAYGVAAAVERRLRRRGPAALTLADLREIAREQLGDVEGDVLIRRFGQWQTLRRLETPLIVLIGGATGVGKSTLATELAHRLGITRVISTDMVRQTMRAFFAPELMPAIHTSSFDAASAVRVPVPRETDLSKVGFMEQTKAVSVGIEAIVARGIDEAQRMVIEGVHIVPGFLERSRWREALVLEFVLAVQDKARHRGNFSVREWETGGIRPLRRYLDHFAQIRRIQKYIVGRAAALDVPVVDNPSLDENLSEVLGAILQRVDEQSAAAGS